MDLKSIISYLYEKSREYDMYITMIIVGVWLYYRLTRRAKEVEEQIILESEVDKQSFLGSLLPERKPFHPNDVLTDKGKQEIFNEGTVKKDEAVEKNEDKKSV